MARTAGLALALCLVAAAPARAAFVPDLKVDLAPTTAGAQPAVGALIAQPPTDTPIKRLTLTFPPGFTAAAAPGASSCAREALLAGGCPADTQIGMFLGLVGAVPIGAPIHKTGPDSFGFVVSVLGGAVDQVVDGALVPRASGALDVRIDQLPALPMSNLALGFKGGGLALVRAPDRCGNYTIDGKFTSHGNEFAIDRTVTPITGCSGTPVVRVSNARLSKTRFRSGGSMYGRRTIIAWWASHAADHTDVLVERRRRGAWRPVGVLVATGKAGDNVLRWDGRVQGRALKPGRYRVRIQPAGSEPGERVRFRIVRR